MLRVLRHPREESVAQGPPPQRRHASALPVVFRSTCVFPFVACGVHLGYHFCDSPVGVPSLQFKAIIPSFLRSGILCRLSRPFIGAPKRGIGGSGSSTPMICSSASQPCADCMAAFLPLVSGLFGEPHCLGHGAPKRGIGGSGSSAPSGFEVVSSYVSCVRDSRFSGFAHRHTAPFSGLDTPGSRLGLVSV